MYDLKHDRKGWSSYFYPCLAAYAFGLVLTYIALLLQIGGQQVRLLSVCCVLASMLLSDIIFVAFEQLFALNSVYQRRQMILCQWG